MELGGYTFLAMTGQIGNYGVMVEDESRPGVDGHTFRQLGLRGEPFSIQTVSSFADLESAQQGERDYKILRGNFHVLVDQVGTSYAQVLVLSVTTRIRPVLSSTDGNTYIIEANWSLQRAA
jgi:hypothetical protein